MTTPKATIAYIADLTRRSVKHLEIEHESPIELTLLAMRKCRELNGEGAMVLSVEFLVDDKVKRHYPSGRRRPGVSRKYRPSR